MKKSYIKPQLEIEAYDVGASIAANCGNIISLGPGDPLTGKETCSEFDDSFDVVTFYSVRKTSFYEEGSLCDCYYTSGGQGYFTS